MENHPQDEAPAQDDNATEQPANPNLPKWAKSILELSKEIPQEALDEFPPDYSENLDYYLYGMPKKSPGPSDTAPSAERNEPMATSSAKDRTETNDNESAPSSEELNEHSNSSGPPGFHKMLIELAETIPQEELDKFPPDYTENLDYYLYDMPKKTP